MDKKKFVVVIDTSVSVRRRNLPKGILNTYVILALDAYDARAILLRMFNQNVANEVRDSIYVYSIDEMTEPLNQLSQQNATFPGWAFLPWNGQRPPVQSEVPPVSTANGNQTLSPTVAPQAPQQPPAPQAPQRPVAPQIPFSQSPRSQEFRGNENPSRSTESRVLTPDQRRLVESVGALSTVEGADEGTNLRVDAPTGLNTRRSSAGYPTPQAPLDPAKAALLKSLGATVPEIVEDPELTAEIMEHQGGGLPLSNSGLDKIEEAPLSEEDLKRMNEDLEKFK